MPTGTILTGRLGDLGALRRTRADRRFHDDKERA